MIYGIGCDLCGVERMEKSLTGPHGAAFARRVFGPAERDALGLPLTGEEPARGRAHRPPQCRRRLCCQGSFPQGGGHRVAGALLSLRDRGGTAALRGTGVPFHRPDGRVGGAARAAGPALPEPRRGGWRWRSASWSRPTGRKPELLRCIKWNDPPRAYRRPIRPILRAEEPGRHDMDT